MTANECQAAKSRGPGLAAKEEQTVPAVAERLVSASAHRCKLLQSQLLLEKEPAGSHARALPNSVLEALAESQANWWLYQLLYVSKLSLHKLVFLRVG